MKVVERYIDEISGREFKKREDAIKSEKKNGGIKKLFSFWRKHKDDGNCRFANGEWCYQRSDVDYLRFVDALIKAVNDYEPWIAEKYEEYGGLKREHIGGGYIIGRFLDDGSSELYDYYCLVSNICKVCYREWGQPYYANNCNHNAKPRAFNQ